MWHDPVYLLGLFLIQDREWFGGGQKGDKGSCLEGMKQSKLEMFVACI